MKIKTFGKTKILFLSIALLISFCVIAILYSLADYINLNQATLTDVRLREIAVQNVNYINNIVRTYVEYMNSFAKMLSKFNDIKSDKALTMLMKMAEGTQFDSLAIDFLDGNSYVSSNIMADFNKPDYIERVKLGKSFITATHIAKNKFMLSFVSPIFKKDAVVGAARGTLNPTKFSGVLGIKIFEGEGYSLLLDSKGEHLAVDENANVLLIDFSFLEASKKFSFDEGYSSEQIQEDFANYVSGEASYSYQGEGRYVYYMPIGINDWLFLVVTPKWVVDKYAYQIKFRVNFVIFALSMILMLILLIIFYYIRQSHNEIARTNMQLLLNERCFKALAEQTNKTIFELDFSTGNIVSISNFKSIFGKEVDGIISPYDVIHMKLIHEDDVESFKETFYSIMKGENVENSKFRLLDANKNFVWCSLSCVVVKHDEDNLYKAIGSIENINEQVQKEEFLKHKAEKDQLTGLFNKITTESLIKSELEKEGSGSFHALIIVDIDSFKGVNDRYGHLSGDIVLVRLSETLTKLFRTNDIIGRVGGDEFFVFMKDITSQEAAIKKAIEINKSFTGHNNGTDSLTISVSLGIAFAKNGDNFEQIYKNADSALYNAKKNGKNTFAVFTG